MIYIDPPYNTKNENFIYPDNFREDYKKILIETGLLSFDEEGEEIPSETLKFFRNIIGARSHTGWLSFMLPRLKLARDLLREDGVIFISIDDNEQANLKLLCDEIFGEENFVYLLSVVNKLNGNDNSSGMMETQEYCLIYAKDSNLFQMGVLNISEDSNKDWQEDEKGWWKEGGSLKATGENAPREKRPNLFFPIYIDEENLNFSLEQDVNHNYELLPITDDREMSWYWEKEKFKKEANEVIIKKTKNGYSLYKKQRPSLGDMPSKRGKTTFYSPKYSTANSNVEIKNLFNGNGVFNYTKSKDLIKDFISLSNARNDIILDFFAGSGTTAQAVMELNAEDGGNREFILVQIDQEIDKDKNKTAYDFCKNELGSQAPVISDITIERVNRAGEKIKETLKQDLIKNTQDLDIGYKVYTLSDKPSIVSDESGGLRLVSGRDGLSSCDIARSLALSSGKILSLPLEEIIKDKLYFCQDSYYLVGIDDEVGNKLESIKDFEIYIDGYSDIDLKNLLNLNVAKKEQIKVIY